MWKVTSPTTTWFRIFVMHLCTVLISELNHLDTEVVKATENPSPLPLQSRLVKALELHGHGTYIDLARIRAKIIPL